MPYDDPFENERHEARVARDTDPGWDDRPTASDVAERDDSEPAVPADEWSGHDDVVERLRISANLGRNDQIHLAFTAQNHPLALYSSTLFLTRAQAYALVRVVSLALADEA